LREKESIGDTDIVAVDKYVYDDDDDDDDDKLWGTCLSDTTMIPAGRQDRRA